MLSNIAYKVEKQHKSFTFFVYIVWFFIFEPFISPYPIGSDLQPLSLILATITLALYWLQGGREQLNTVLIYIIALFVETYHLLLFGTVAGVYLASVIYVSFTLKYYRFLTPKFILAVLIFHMIGLFWQALDAVSFSNVLSHFINLIKYTGHLGRGLTGFATEPTISAALITLYSIIYFRFFSSKSNKLKAYFMLIIYFIGIYMTGSSFGYFSIPIVLFSFFIKDKELCFTNTKNFFFLGLAIFFVALIVLNLDLNHRGVLLFQQTFYNPELLLLDASLQERFRSLYVGWTSIFNYKPFGIGHENFSDATRWVDSNYNLGVLFKNSRDIQGSASGLANILVGTGLIGVVFYFSLFAYVKPSFKFRNLPLIFLSILMFLFSFSPAFPFIYILMILTRKLDNSNAQNIRV
jgi:hypothetical protein